LKTCRLPEQARVLKKEKGIFSSDLYRISIIIDLIVNLSITMVLIKTILGLGMLSMCVAPVIAAAMPESAEGLADVPDGLADVFDEVADVSPAISEELTAREELSDQRVKFPKSQKRLFEKDD